MNELFVYSALTVTNTLAYRAICKLKKMKWCEYDPRVDLFNILIGLLKSLAKSIIIIHVKAATILELLFNQLRPVY